MEQNYTVKLVDLVERMNFETLYTVSDYESVMVCKADVNRPGLQLAGFYDYFDPDRLQIIGKVEISYLERFSEEERREKFSKLMSQGIPALVVCRNMEPFPECREMAEEHNVTLLRTSMDTSECMAALIGHLKVLLAPRITRHGVLVEVYGEGLLLLGESGVGKSEAAIELVKRGHRLIADDAVEIKKVSETTLVGSAPELIRHYIELRGIGVINVRRIFGIGAVKPSEKIDLVISLETWKDGMVYDRFGAESEFTHILGVEVPSMLIPVKPGRNLAVIIEVAAMNIRQKKMGYNSALELTAQINKYFESNAEESE